MYVAMGRSVVTRNRDFRRLFAAELVVFGADWFVMVPLLVLLPELTGSGVWGALVLAADTGIVALLLPYTGTIADRFDRRKIMMIANVASVLAVALRGLPDMITGLRARGFEFVTVSDLMAERAARV